MWWGNIWIADSALWRNEKVGEQKQRQGMFYTLDTRVGSMPDDSWVGHLLYFMKLDLVISFIFMFIIMSATTCIK